MPAVSETKDQMSDLRSFIEAKTQRNSEIVGAIKGTGDGDNPLVLEKGMPEEFRSNLAAIKEARTNLDLLLEHDDTKGYVAGLGAPEREATALKAAFSSALGEHLPSGGTNQAKSLGQMFLDSEEFKALKASGGTNMERPFTVKGDLGSFARKDIYSTLPSGTRPFGTIERDPMVELPQRQERVRDLFPNRPTTASGIDYFRQTGFVNNAAMVAERSPAQAGPPAVPEMFAQKPQSSFTWTSELAMVRTIAHWEAAHRNVLADEPQLRGIIDNELLYGLRLREDDQILNGTGTGEDLLGVRNAPGTQNYVQGSTTLPTGARPDNKADAIRRAATRVMLAEYEPTGVVVHDSDWEDIELLKDANGQYLLAMSIALGGEQRVWRMPVVSTPAMQKGFAVVAAFGLGVQLYNREEGNIRISESHADFFTRNAVVVLAESRLALAIKRPESVVEISFS